MGLFGKGKEPEKEKKDRRETPPPDSSVSSRRAADEAQIRAWRDELAIEKIRESIAPGTEEREEEAPPPPRHEERVPPQKRERDEEEVPKEGSKFKDELRAKEARLLKEEARLDEETRLKEARLAKEEARLREEARQAREEALLAKEEARKAHEDIEVIKLKEAQLLKEEARLAKEEARLKEEAREVRADAHALEDKVKALTDQILRLQADFSNFRTRTEKEKTEAIRFGREATLEKLIGLTDVLNDAIRHSQNASDVETLKKGFEMVIREFVRMLKSEGAEPIEAVGKKFDPNLHEAVEQVETGDEKKNDTVLEEIQKGYTANGRLLRPAKVRVAKFKGTHSAPPLPPRRPILPRDVEEET